MIRKERYMSWDTYFMAVAFLSSFRSKDSKFQNGACIVNSDKKIVGTGYNGLPSGCDDKDPEFWEGNDDDTLQVNPRHAYNIHAEKNAILNSKVDIKDSTMYCIQFPCNICAQTICQAGIKRLVYMFKKPGHEDVNKYCDKMFNSCSVETICYDDLNIKDKEFIEKLKKLNKEMY